MTTDTGEIVWSASYDAHGKVTKIHEDHFDNPLRLQGQFFDSEIDLCYNRHRYYDPDMGSFISADPLGLEAGENNYSNAPNGELLSAFAKIEPQHIGTGTSTTSAAREFARSLGNSTDDAGHAIGKNLGGLGGKTSGNIFSQSPNVNRGAFSQFEQQVAKQVQAGKEVYVRVVPKYNPGTTRAHEVLYQVRIDGKTVSRTFTN